MAAGLAVSVSGQTDAQDVRPQIRQAMQRCVARVPEQEEIGVLFELYQSELKRFQETPGTAKKFLNECLAPKQQSQEKEDHLAALTMVCNVLLNLDETINY